MSNPTHACVCCGKPFSVNDPDYKQYCKCCIKIHRRETSKIRSYKKRYKKKLRNFYDFQKIPLIQSPYFIDEVESKTAQDVVNGDITEIVVGIIDGDYR